MHRLTLLMLVACGSSGSGGKPAGTLADPVDVCERIADVCRIDKAKLGVCTQRQASAPLVCASQH